MNDLRESYKQLADMIPNWKTMDKNELCNLYIQHEDDEFLRESYISAIILRYWNKINKLYQRSKPAATLEDCYEWVIEAILYALKNRRWLDKDSTIYLDPTGPDKVINRNSECRRLTFFQQIFNDNKRVLVNTLSVNLFTIDENDEVNNSYDKFTDENAIIDDNELSVFDFIRQKFERQEYVFAFVVDTIISCKNPDENYESFVKQIAQTIRRMPDDYADVFANTYDLLKEDVRTALTYTKKLDISNLCDMIRVMLKKMKYDKVIRSVCFG